MEQNIDDLIMISALQHYAFCPRQCALIYLEQAWEDNRLTVEGSILHERVHAEGNEMRAGVRIERGVSLRSLRLGLIGKADVVEFHRVENGAWQPFPVEYKRGKPKPDHCDQIQLCAQALCLEEMLHTSIPSGALFYGQTRRRLDVNFDDKLRRETEAAAMQVRLLLESRKTPKPVYEKRCENCSLMLDCLPKAIQKRRSVKDYLQRMAGES
ncbi:MAG: CRISPR-associated protein Cas4 [Pseudomonadota bacterium]|nr:CRISPR-associated protein Cas4 [Pseudomonadota bacterium]